LTNFIVSLFNQYQVTMHYKTLVPLFLASGAVASYAEVSGQQAPQDGGDIGKFLGDLTTAFSGLDAVLSGVSKENIASSGDKFIAQGQKFNTMLNKNAEKIRSSKKVSSIFSFLPLISRVGPLIGAVNKTLIHTGALQPIANEAGLSQKLRDGLYAAEPGIVAITTAIIGNIDINAMLPAPKAGKDKDGNPTPPKPRAPMPTITDSQVKPVVDGIIDTGIGLFNGSITTDDLMAKAGALFAGFGKGKGKKKDGAAAPAAAATTMTAPAAGGHGSMPGMQMRFRA
jgi:hypothetical protein